MVDLNSLCKEIHQDNIDKGFYKKLGPNTYIPQYQLMGSLMLIVTEVAEAAECIRENRQSDFAVEIADIIIRCLDLCGNQRIDIEEVIMQKLRYNRTRPFKHGKNG